jgi:hypothetical protein
MLVSAVMTVIGAVATAGAWLLGQITATLGNWRDFATDRDWFEERGRSWFTFAILAPLRYYGQLVKWAIVGKPREQIFAAAALAASLVIASAGILTVVAVAIFIPLTLIGLLRMIPAVNQGYDGVANVGRSSTKWIPDRER